MIPHTCSAHHRPPIRTPLDTSRVTAQASREGALLGVPREDRQIENRRKILNAHTFKRKLEFGKVEISEHSIDDVYKQRPDHFGRPKPLI